MRQRLDNPRIMTPTFEGDGISGAGCYRMPSNATVTATGSIQTDAAQVNDGFTDVTGADGTKGVILPVARPGMQVWIKGTTSAVLKVYPNTGAQINAIAANSALSLTTGLIPSIFIAKSATQWYSFPLVAS